MEKLCDIEMLEISLWSREVAEIRENLGNIRC